MRKAQEQKAFKKLLWSFPIATAWADVCLRDCYFCPQPMVFDLVIKRQWLKEKMILKLICCFSSHSRSSGNSRLASPGSAGFRLGTPFTRAARALLGGISHERPPSVGQPNDLSWPSVLFHRATLQVNACRICGGRSTIARICALRSQL